MCTGSEFDHLPDAKVHKKAFDKGEGECPVVSQHSLHGKCPLNCPPFSLTFYGLVVGMGEGPIFDMVRRPLGIVQMKGETHVYDLNARRVALVASSPRSM